MTSSSLMLTERAERLMCLARAFLPPQSDSICEAICHHLAEDLTELQQILNSSADEVIAFSRSVSTIENPARLLNIYSALFLAPPAPALPNLGFYLDGAMMGTTCQDIESLYLKYGLERDAHFKDSADHIALYLQFLGWILAQAEEQNLAADTAGMLETLTDTFHTLTRHAVPSLTRLHEQILKTEKEMSLPPVYGQLTRLALSAAQEDAIALRAHLPARPAAQAASTEAETSGEDNPTGTSDPVKQFACNSCGAEFAADEGLANMITILEAQGLDTAHMRICPKCRTADMGMTAMKIPTLKKAS